MNLLYIMLGGSIGAICRYLVGLGFMKTWQHPPIPTAMLVVNLLGSLGLGFVYGIYIEQLTISPYEDLIFLTLGLGFFGAFTTFSTFSVETVQLIRSQEYRKAIAYMTCSILGSLLFFLLGISLG